MNDDEFFLWYQEQLGWMWDDDSCLPFLFGHLSKDKLYKDSNKGSCSEWAQNCLDVMYRFMTCSLVGQQVLPPEENNKTLEKLAKLDPNTGEGTSWWYAYQFHLTDEGENFCSQCGILDQKKLTEFSPLYKEKLTALFDEHGVGFDKSKFIPIQF